MTAEMRAIAMGVHVLDVLVRPVEAIPEGQGGQLVDEIKITAAGSAGGAAITLAKLGAGVHGRRGRRADPRPRARERGRHLGRPPCPRRSGAARVDRAGAAAPRLPTS